VQIVRCCQAAPKSLAAAAQAEQTAAGPAAKRRRVGQSVRIFRWRSRVFPVVSSGANGFPGIFPALQAVMTVGRSPSRDDGVSFAAGATLTAAHPDPIVESIVGLLAAQTVADDRIVATAGAPAREQRERERLHPGSVFSSVGGSAIKRITAGVKARRRPPLPNSDP
jgi:hypothetical protein